MSAPDTTVQLGSVTFQGFEVPDRIVIGGSQAVRVHRMIGGKRVLDAMGDDPSPIPWSGRFRGEEAASRARLIEAMRKAGKPVSLTFGEFAYTVLVQEFSFDYQAFYEIPYSIRCEVVSDDASPGAEGSRVGPTQMITEDYVSALSFSSPVGSSLLNGKMATLGSAISSVREFASAPASVLASVLTPALGASAAVRGLFDVANLDIENVVGVVAGGRVGEMVAGLTRQVSAMADAANLHDAGSFLGRLETNLDAIGEAGSHIVVAGADLFKLAQTAYGDATEWNTIARANGLTDPEVSGIVELVIPPTPAGTGGILG